MTFLWHSGKETERQNVGTLRDYAVKYVYRIWVVGRVYFKDHWRPYEMIFDDYDGH